MTTIEPLLCSHCGNQCLQPIAPAYVEEFPHLSRTNDPPVTAEIPAIEADILTRENEIQALQAGIDTLQRALDGLKSRQSAAKEALVVQRSIIHPLRRLPPELLQEIFKECMPELGVFSPSRVCESPWNLSVCQRWREISVSYQKLWSVIQQTDNDPREEVTELLLQRSASFPLGVCLVQGPSPLEKSHQIVRTILPSSSRWKSLDVNVDDMEALMPIRGHLDNLEELSISLCPASTPHTPLTMFQLAPALKKLHIVHLSTVSEAPLLLLPWSNIIDCTIGHMYDEDESESEDDEPFIRLEPLVSCVNLVELWLYALSSSAAALLPDDIVLPHLVSLTLQGTGRGAIAAFLGKLKLPALAVLDSIGSLVARSNCRLTSLELISIMNFHSSLITFITNAFSLRKLVLSRGSDLFRHLICIPTSDDSETFIQLLDMLESAVCVHDGRKIKSEPSEVARVTLLRETGLSFIIKE
ncbi:hypothetical protein C8J56DRAFT_935773 [Mycena floridula]|nr:hypothetical protein C8J56DRAFT_935773 [Mycena floridula]